MNEQKNNSLQEEIDYIRGELICMISSKFPNPVGKHAALSSQKISAIELLRMFQALTAAAEHENAEKIKAYRKQFKQEETGRQGRLKEKG